MVCLAQASSSSGEVNPRASSRSSAADAAAPRSRARRAASSSRPAALPSGGSTASAVCLARASGSVRVSAIRRWSARRTRGSASVRTTDASIGCVKRNRSDPSSTTPRLERRLERRPCVLDLGDGLHLEHGRLRERGQGDERLARRLRQAREPASHGLREGLRQRKLLPRLDLPAPGLERPPDLERVERVAAADLANAPEQRARERESEPRVQELVQRAGAQGPEVEPVSALADRRAVEAERDVAGPVGDEHPDLLVRETAKREREGARRRSVEPLGVVDGDQHGPLLREASKHRQQGRRERASLGWQSARPRPPGGARPRARGAGEPAALRTLRAARRREGREATRTRSSSRARPGRTRGSGTTAPAPRRHPRARASSCRGPRLRPGSRRRATPPAARGRTRAAPAPRPSLLPPRPCEGNIAFTYACPLGGAESADQSHSHSNTSVIRWEARDARAAT